MNTVYTVILAMIFTGGIGVILALIIGLSVKWFSVTIDENIEKITELLPGANCGGCGFAGCSEFAKAIVKDNIEVSNCPVASSSIITEISKALGLDSSQKEPQVAIVLCGGDNSKAKQSAKYNGVTDCKYAMIISSGGKACTYGCLGLASCARICPFDAIEMRNGLAIVHPDLCVGCGKCVEICPRKLIKMVPKKAKTHVFCSSPEKGPLKKQVCSVPCIGCRKCTKVTEEEGQMEIKGFLIQTNYENPPLNDITEAAKCPTNCLKSSETFLSENKEEGVA